MCYFGLILSQHLLITKGVPFCFQALGLPLSNKSANAMNYG